MFGQTQVIGRCGQDAKMFTTQAGKQIADVSVAMNKGFGDARRTVWVKVKGFDKTADKMKDLKKGMLIAFYGDLDEEKWTDKQGIQHSQIVVVASRVYSLERSDDAAPVIDDPFA